MGSGLSLGREQVVEDVGDPRAVVTVNGVDAPVPNLVGYVSAGLAIA